MKRSIIVLGVLAAVGIGAGGYYFTRGDGAQASGVPGSAGGRGGNAGGGPGGGFGGPGGFGGFGGGGPRLPMTVEMGQVKRGDVSAEIDVVGNLIGAQTVEALPKVAGRLAAVNVRLGDRVTRGQAVARIEDQEIQEQVKQQQAAYNVAAATIRQREAGLKQAQANLDRSRNLFERQLIPKQTYDDVDAAYSAAAALLDLAKAQFEQAKARLDELKINLANTVIASPVSGFIGKRALDPGAWVTTNSSFISVVDIGIVRLVANVVEKDLSRLGLGLQADVEVDAYPGEKFTGKIAHVAPVLDPATRTAQIEVEIENPQFRLKPGMYARVSFSVDKRENALLIPTVSLVDMSGNKGVFLPSPTEQGQVASFKKIEIGLVNQDFAEVKSGLADGDTIVTTGSAALRDGDRILLPGEAQSGGAAGAGGNGRGDQGGGRRGGTGSGGQRGGGGQRGSGQRAGGTE